jgi:sigma-B regulation protein RsbU (phosphoserine phosphatase)
MTAEALDDFFAALRDDDANALYDQAPCGYLSTSPEGLIIKVNQTFLTLTGFQREDLVGVRTFAQLLSAGGRIYHETHYAPMLHMQGTARGIALDIVCSDGSKLPVLVSSMLERSEAGTPVVIRSAIFDATERREYERELLRERVRAEESRERADALARTLQQTLIPPAPPPVPGLDVAAAYRPAGAGDEVGGDFYDIFQIAEDDWCVVIGDVCGKGVEAAIITALARYTIRAAAVRFPSAHDALETLNEVLLKHETTRFCTAVIMRLKRTEGFWRARISTGGHPLPMLITADGGLRSVGQQGALLGVFDNPDLVDTEVDLVAGDTLVLYTDGVTEGRNATDFYGETRLDAAASASYGTAESMVQGILDDVLQFQDGRPRDDIAVVAVRVPH